MVKTISLPSGRQPASLKRNFLTEPTSIVGEGGTVLTGTNTTHVVDWQSLGLKCGLSLSNLSIDAGGLCSGREGEDLNALKLRDGSGAAFDRVHFYGSDYGTVVMAKNTAEINFTDCWFADANGNEFSNLVYLRHCQKITFDHCHWFGTVPGVGLQIAGGTEIVIDSCTFAAQRQPATGRNEALYVWYDDNTNIQSTGIVVRRCLFEGYQQAVTIRLNTKIKLIENTFLNCGVGIGARDLRAGWSIENTNNEFYNCGQDVVIP